MRGDRVVQVGGGDRERNVQVGEAVAVRGGLGAGCLGGAEQRARQAGKPKSQRDGAPRLIEGHVTQGWREAWGDVVNQWPERFAARA